MILRFGVSCAFLLLAACGGGNVLTSTQSSTSGGDVVSNDVLLSSSSSTPINGASSEPLISSTSSQHQSVSQGSSASSVIPPDSSSSLSISSTSAASSVSPISDQISAEFRPLSREEYAESLQGLTGFQLSGAWYYPLPYADPSYPILREVDAFSFKHLYHVTVTWTPSLPKSQRPSVERRAFKK